MARYYPEPPPEIPFDQEWVKTIYEWTFRELNRISQLSALDPPIYNTKVTMVTAGGTFVADLDMLFVDVKAWGGGGGGGGCAATGVGEASAATGGNAGAMASGRFLASQIGGSQSVTIGAGGTGNSGADGSAGGNTTFGSLLSAKGGEGGNASATSPSFVAPSPNTSTQSATGDIRGWTHLATSAMNIAGTGGMQSVSGQNELGGGKAGVANGNGTNANANTGAGGGGGTNGASQAARTGGDGGSGLIMITEYLGL